MADNTIASAGSTIATDDIGGVHYPRSKVVFGVDGAATDVSNAAPLPAVTPNATVTGTITAANTNLITGAATAGSSVALTVPDAHTSWTVTLSGTYSAATILAFQCSIDGTNWYYTNGRRNHNTLGVNETVSSTSTDVAGGAAPTGGNPSLWKGTVGAVKFFRVTATTYTASDSISVRIDSSAGVGGTFLLGSVPAGTSIIGAVAPVDSLRTTYSALLNNTVVAGVVTAAVPTWEIQNPTANTTKLLRITRVHRRYRCRAGRRHRPRHRQRSRYRRGQLLHGRTHRRHSEFHRAPPPDLGARYNSDGHHLPTGVLVELRRPSRAGDRVASRAGVVVAVLHRLHRCPHPHRFGGVDRGEHLT